MLAKSPCKGFELKINSSGLRCHKTYVFGLKSSMSIGELSSLCLKLQQVPNCLQIHQKPRNRKA